MRGTDEKRYMYVEVVKSSSRSFLSGLEVLLFRASEMSDFSNFALTSTNNTDCENLRSGERFLFASSLVPHDNERINMRGTWFEAEHDYLGKSKGKSD